MLWAYYFSNALTARARDSFFLGLSAVLKLAFTRCDRIESLRCITYAPKKVEGVRKTGRVIETLQESMTLSVTLFT